MVRVISQETFDSVVKENVNEFEMSIEEATEDAIEQFKSQVIDSSHIQMKNEKNVVLYCILQGVDLSNIVTTTLSNDHVISKTIAKLKSGENNLQLLCSTLAEECNKGVYFKINEDPNLFTHKIFISI